MSTARAPALLLAILLAAPSCSWFRRKAKTPAPPAPAPPVAAKPAPEPPQLPVPPPVEQSTAGTPPASTVITPTPPPGKPPVQEKKTAASKPAARPHPPSTVELPPAEPHTAPPQLMQILTPAEQRFYSARVNESLRRARRNLDAAMRRKLTADQQRIAERIRVFLAQADEARARDLVTAHSLATRADVLAQELVKGAR